MSGRPYGQTVQRPQPAAHPKTLYASRVQRAVESNDFDGVVPATRSLAPARPQPAGTPAKASAKASATASAKASAQPSAAHKTLKLKTRDGKVLAKVRLG